MSMIYALVSRGQQTILSSFTSCEGNFPQIAMDVRTKLFFRFSRSQTYKKHSGSTPRPTIPFTHTLRRDSSSW